MILIVVKVTRIQIMIKFIIINKSNNIDIYVYVYIPQKKLGAWKKVTPL